MITLIIDKARADALQPKTPDGALEAILNFRVTREGMPDAKVSWQYNNHPDSPCTVAIPTPDVHEILDGTDDLLTALRQIEIAFDAAVWVQLGFEYTAKWQRDEYGDFKRYSDGDWIYLCLYRRSQWGDGIVINGLRRAPDFELDRNLDDGSIPGMPMRLTYPLPHQSLTRGGFLFGPFVLPPSPPNEVVIYPPSSGVAANEKPDDTSES